MRNRNSIWVAVILVLAFLGSGVKLIASEVDQATQMTFNAPIQIPGRVLSPGTYWFTVDADGSKSNLNVIQIWDSNRAHLITTVMALVDYHLDPSGKTLVKLGETPSNAPDALEAWFYPGRNSGHQFIFPKGEATKIARATGKPVLAVRDSAYSSNLSPAQMKSEHVVAVDGSGNETELDNSIDKSDYQVAPKAK